MTLALDTNVIPTTIHFWISDSLPLGLIHCALSSATGTDSHWDQDLYIPARRITPLRTDPQYNTTDDWRGRLTDWLLKCREIHHARTHQSRGTETVAGNCNNIIIKIRYVTIILCGYYTIDRLFPALFADKCLHTVPRVQFTPNSTYKRRDQLSSSSSHSHSQRRPPPPSCPDIRSFVRLITSSVITISRWPEKRLPDRQSGVISVLALPVIYSAWLTTSHDYAVPR